MIPPTRLARSLLAPLLLSCATSAVPASHDRAEEAMKQIRPEAIRADMRFLADDLLEGRGTATRGHELAARWMAAQFEQMGLEPVGDAGGYYQTVPLRSASINEDKTSLTLALGGKEEGLVYRRDYVVRADPRRAESTVEGSVVFVGYGVTAPDHAYDDYGGIDTRGKIVALLNGAPDFESSVKAYYTSTAVKASTAAAHGAIGLIALNTPVSEQRYPFAHQVRDSVSPTFNWLDHDGKPDDYVPELKAIVFLSVQGVDKFFAGSGHTANEVLIAARDGQSVSFPMPRSAKIHVATYLGDTHSPNVVAMLKGSDPVLKNEYVVYSAHLDHLGIGEPVKGDNIYHGAIDNASGSANLVQIAQAFSAMKPAPRRSILFLSATGEERGLLGSDYFAHNSTVAKSAIIANVNMDGDLMFWPLHSVIAFGAEHSSLDLAVRKTAARMGLTVSPDPLPEQVGFIRNDAYSFVRQGIPAIWLVPGFSSEDPTINPLTIFNSWLTRYHQPQDSMAQPGLDFSQAAKFARFALLCGYLIAEDPVRPTWNKGDFFGDKYAK